MNNCDISEGRGERLIADYQKDIRGVMRAFWNGTVDFDQFFDLMLDTVRLGLTRIWNAGAAECGIQPSELSPEEKTKLAQMINSENTHIFEVADFIEQNSKANGGKFRQILPRAALWGQRGLDAFNQAKILACGDQKLKWNYDPAKENCPSCKRLNGKVKRASFWRRSGIRPQNPPNNSIACGGWRCGCSLDPTDEPVSRGPLPKMP